LVGQGYVVALFFQKRRVSMLSIYSRFPEILHGVQAKVKILLVELFQLQPY
jgi:hypothetical protein